MKRSNGQGEPGEGQPALGRAAATAEMIRQVEKKYGSGALMRLGDAAPRMAVEVVPTGSLGLDLALGIGGIPRGRVTEVFGPEGSGKSTLALHLVAQAQWGEGVAVYIDTEHCLDPQYAARCGVKVDELLISQPDSGEEALNIVEIAVRSGAVDLVVTDSVAALAPGPELEGEAGEPQVGLQARLMSQALRMLTGCIGKGGAAVLFLNQLRERIGVTRGSVEYTPGGRALRFYSSMRIDLRRWGSLKGEDSRVIGQRVQAKVVKNKLAPPFRSAKFDIIYGEGISREGELLSLGAELGTVRQNGSFYSFGETRLGHGEEAARWFLKEHQDIALEIGREVRSRADLLGGAAWLSSGDAGPGDDPAPSDVPETE